MQTQGNRPTLNDPKEWALIRSMYFQKDLQYYENEEVDQLERLDRQESKSRFNQKSPR